MDDGPLEVLHLHVGELHLLLRVEHLGLQLDECLLQLEVGGRGSCSLLVRHLSLGVRRGVSRSS